MKSSEFSFSTKEKFNNEEIFDIFKTENTNNNVKITDKKEIKTLIDICNSHLEDIPTELIKNFKNIKSMFEILANSFKNALKMSETYDLFISKCILTALRYHKLDLPEAKLLIIAISDHFNDYRSSYHERGCIVASVFLNTKDFNINEMQETKKLHELIPDSILKEEKKENFKMKDEFSNYTKVHNDWTTLKESQWKPKYIQEGIKIILEEKDHEKIKSVFKHFSELITKATDRVIISRCRDAYDALINYDNFEEYKSIALTTLFIRASSDLLDSVLDDFFSYKTSTKVKIVLCHSFSAFIEKADFISSRKLFEELVFRYKRTPLDASNIVINEFRNVLYRGFLRFNTKKQIHHKNFG